MWVSATDWAQIIIKFGLRDSRSGLVWVNPGVPQPYDLVYWSSGSLDTGHAHISFVSEVLKGNYDSIEIETKDAHQSTMILTAPDIKTLRDYYTTH